MNDIDAQIAAYVAERDAALLALDMDWARRMMPRASNDDVRITAMHKARVHAVRLPDDARRASQRWLLERGFTDLLGSVPDLNAPLPAAAGSTGTPAGTGREGAPIHARAREAPGA